MNGEIREFFLYQWFIMWIHITDYRELYKAARVFLFALIKKMEKHRRDHIYERVQSEFGENVFRHYYYCSGLSLENFKRKLKIRHGQECRILVRFDHIVVEESDGQIIVYLLVSHNSGKCADFLHQGKVDRAFYFLLMAECNRQILESTSCSRLAIKKNGSTSLLIFFSCLPLFSFLLLHWTHNHTFGICELDTSSF